MAAKMTITIEIVNDDGERVQSTRTDLIPGFDDFEKNGFRENFDQIETAILESRKEVSDAAMEAYLSCMSKKSLSAVGP